MTGKITDPGYKETKKSRLTGGSFLYQNAGKLPDDRRASGTGRFIDTDGLS